MTIRNRLASMALTTILWSLICPGGHAREYVRDHAGVFTPEARQAAEEEIDRIVQQHNVEIIVETFAALPTSRQQKWTAAKTNVAKEQVITQWAEEQAANAHADGIYVFICKEPPRVRVIVGPEAKARGFTARDGSNLYDEIRRSFEKKKFDKGLVAVTDAVNKRFEIHEQGNRWFLFVGIIAGAAVLWGFLFVVLKTVKARRSTTTEEVAEPELETEPKPPDQPPLKKEDWLWEGQEHADAKQG